MAAMACQQLLLRAGHPDQGAVRGTAQFIRGGKGGVTLVEGRISFLGEGWVTYCIFQEIVLQ